MAKRVVFVIVVLSLLLGSGLVAGCSDGVSDNAVVKVGNTEIKEDEFNQRVMDFAAQSGMSEEDTDPEMWAQFEASVLDYLVTLEVATQKAEELGVSVTDEEVQADIDTIVQAYYDGDQAAFEEDLKQYGLTLEQYKSTEKEYMLLNKVSEEATAEITEIPQEEIAAFYEANKAEFLIPETRVTRHILIAPDGKETNETTTTTAADSTTTTEITEADWAAALETAEEVRKLLVAGGDWGELAAKYSDDTYTATMGGDLGEVAKGEMVQEFEEAVFSLEVDEISEPIKSTYGYHIIQVTGINEARQQTLEEVSDNISAELLNTKKVEAWQLWLNNAKTELGVTYREDLQPTTTLPAESSSTTLSGDTTTSSAGQTITTGDTTTTTAKP